MEHFITKEQSDHIEIFEVTSDSYVEIDKGITGHFVGRAKDEYEVKEQIKELVKEKYKKVFNNEAEVNGKWRNLILMECLIDGVNYYDYNTTK